MNALPCFLCGTKVNVKTDKNGKPYFICNPCGVQCFIRREHGIERLRTLQAQLEDTQIRIPPGSLVRIRALLQEIEGVKGEIAHVDDFIGLVFQDADRVRERNALEEHLQKSLSELEGLCEGAKE